MTIAMKNIVCKDNRNTAAEGIKELADNIKAVGLLQPIRLKPVGKKYHVTAGRRRFKAMQLLGVSELQDNEYILTTADANEKAEAFFENFHRENLTLSEEVEQLAGLIRPELKLEDLAAMVGKSIRWVALRINLANLCPEWMEILKNREENSHWTPRHLEEIAKYPAETQKSIKEEFIYRVPSLERLRDDIAKSHERDLKNATFDKHDCESCDKRSMCSLHLFGDEDNKCLDSKCYDEKTRLYVEGEIKKIKKEGKEIYIVSGHGYCHDSKIKAMPSWGYKLKDSGSINAFCVSGDNAGKYCSIKISADNKEDAEAFIAGRSEKNNTEEPAKKEKSLEDRELDLHRKRTKKAIELAKDFFLSDTFESVAMKHSAPKTLIIALSLMFGTRQYNEMYVNDVNTEFHEISAKLKSEKGIFEKHCWKSVTNSMSNRIAQQLNRTLEQIDDKELKVFCEILEIDYQTLFYAKASEEIQPSKALLAARENAKNEAA